MASPWQQRWNRSVALWPDRPAVLSADGALSFAELDARAQHQRRILEQQPDWRPGGCQAWGWTDAREDLPRLLGLWLAGGVWIAHAAGSRMAPIAAELAASVRGPAAGAGLWQSLLFSSGSTGAPKVLVRGWRQALAEADAYAELLALPAGARSVMLIHPWFGASTKQLLAGLLHGWCQVLGRDGLAATAHGGDLLYATPSQLQALGPPPQAAKGFGVISLTGEACGETLWPLLRRWGRADGMVLNALGASETGVVANQLLSLQHPWQPFAGQPAKGKQLDLLDEQAERLQPAGAIGRLRVRGRALIEGQLLRHEGRWQWRPVARWGNGMEHTSHDLARWDGQGRLELLGRSNQLLKRHGEWIDATPLQRWLDRQPGVRRCQLLADSEGLVAWLETDSLDAGWLAQLGSGLRGELEDQRLLPRRLCALRVLPQNSHGKLDLAVLQAARADPSPLGGVGWSPTAEAPPLMGLPSPGLELDSLDQAQLLASLQDTNLLWCGTIHRLVAAACFPGVGVVGLPFPRIPQEWRVGQGPGLRQESQGVLEALLQLTQGRLGRGLWLGGYSAAAWQAYALAELLLERGFPVVGVVLLDPVNLFSGTFRWSWRRRMADRWRRGAGALFYRHLPPERLRRKAWTQELLGRWRPSPQALRLLVIRSRWRHGVKRHQIEALQPRAQVLELPCRRHEDVVTDPALIARWQRWIAEALAAPSG